MKVFLDTNILLDFFVENRPNALHSLRIFKGAKDGIFKAYASAISIADCLYILEVSYKMKSAEELLLSIIDLVEILPSSKEIIKEAFVSGFKDKEDALQYFTAKAEAIDFILTSDTKGFSKSEIPILTPYQFVIQHLKK